MFPFLVSIQDMQEHQTVKAKVKDTKPVIGVKRTVLSVRGQF